MYYPYFRGKQNELITIRDLAPVIARSNFVPIIEPVKQIDLSLNRAIDAVLDANGKAVFVINPSYGDYSADEDSLSKFLEDNFADKEDIYAGILLKNKMSVESVLGLCDANAGRPIVLIHAGFTEANDLSTELGERSGEMTHVFIESDCGKLYQRHFKKGERVLMRDGFERRKNREYPPVELFSDLHITFEEEGMDGFGDFLIVGDEYSESGGPAYAIAIHLSFIDAEKDEAMYIYHFVSDRQDTPKDPAGKFAEALAKLIDLLAVPGSSKVFETEAVREFRNLHDRGHFPGLGYIKKLSMQHHIETLSTFLAR